MKDKLFELIEFILTIVLAAGFITCIWINLVLGIKIILTTIVVGCFLELLE